MPDSSMIYFACKQCGKRFERPDETAGTLVFCECGTGNRVPWESTVPPEERETPPPKSAAIPPRVLPVAHDFDGDGDRQRPRPRRRPEAIRRDPAFCFNHEDVPSVQKCADCGEVFCAGCIVTFLDATLCGPCKNYRLRKMQRPPRASILSILSLVGAVVVGGISFFLLLFGLGLTAQNPTGGGTVVLIALGGIALLLQLGVALLAVFGLRDVETNRRVSGRAAALSALATVLGSSILLAALALLAIRAIM